MKKVTRNWIVGTLIASGPILLAVTSAQKPIDSVFPGLIPHQIWPYVSFVGVISLALGVALWLVIRIPIPTRMSAYECYVARKSELNKIHRLANQFFGNDVSSLGNMHAWHKVNHSIFKVMYQVKRTDHIKKRRLVGYYCIVPITKQAAERLEKREIKGSGFLPEHIEKDGESPFAFYIGAIGANGWLARGNIRTALHNEINSIWLKKTKKAYTRPVTTDGLKLVKEYDFTPADSNDEGKLDCLYSNRLVIPS